MFTFAVNFGLNENLTFSAYLQSYKPTQKNSQTFKTIIIFYSQPAICYVVITVFSFAVLHHTITINVTDNMMLACIW
jgi:hypothetical protein